MLAGLRERLWWIRPESLAETVLAGLRERLWWIRPISLAETVLAGGTSLLERNVVWRWRDAGRDHITDFAGSVAAHDFDWTDHELH